MGAIPSQRESVEALRATLCIVILQLRIFTVKYLT